MNKMRRKYADGPYGQIHFYDGEQGRPLVLLHQAPMTGRQFESVYGHLQQRGIRPIAIDLPGFGMSDVTDFVPVIENWSPVIVSVLDMLQLSRANVLGHHTGALVAADFCCKYPERVDALVMHGALIATEAEREQRLEVIHRDERDFVYKNDGAHLKHVFHVRDQLYGPGADPALITRYVVEQFMGLGPFWYAHQAAYRFDLTRLLPALPRRTLVMTNTGDVMHERTLRIRDRRPDLRVAVMEGGGVDIVDQQPQAWVDIVTSFLFQEPPIA